MIYLKTILALMLVSHTTYVHADGPGPIAYETAVSAPVQTVAPTSHYGSGQYYANAPCPYNQSTLPASALSRADRIKDDAQSIAAKLEKAKRSVAEIEGERVFAACKTAVNKIIRNACGGGNEARGEEGIDMFEDHMRGTMLMSFNQLNYTRSYEVAYEGIMTSKMTMNRMVADASFEPAPGDWDDGIDYDDKAVDVLPDSPIVRPGNSDCFNYALNDGMIDSRICFATNESNSGTKQNCKSCLRPSGAYPRGLYPTKFKEYFNLEQEVARLERDYKLAVGKAACVETHVDNAPATGPNAEAYRRCILDADPMSTAADYCLFCDEAGRTAQKQGFDINRWGPSILTAGAWILGGIYANNQVKKTREGNWEAGYPSDDRQPVVMTNYVMNGFGQVVNSLQSAGAFGCSPSAGVNGQGQVITTNGGIGGMLPGIFSGNGNIQVGGANGYPGGYFDAYGNLSGGVFNGNPNAGPWVGGNLDGQIAAQNAAIAQAQANLQALQQQNAQRIAGMNALGELNTTLQGLQAQNARTNQQIAQIQAQANSIYAGLNMGGSSGYAGYNGYGNGALGGLGAGSGGLRIGLDVSGYAGFGLGGNAGYYGGAPGTQFPPYPPQYNGPGYNLPNGNYNNGNYYNGNYNTGGSSSGSGLAVPSLGL